MATFIYGFIAGVVSAAASAALFIAVAAMTGEALKDSDCGR